MKTRLPGVTAWALCMLWSARLVAQPPQAAPAIAEAAVPAENGTAVLQSAIATLERYNTITASIRQRANVFGRQLVGTGRYLQGPPRYNLLRLELSLQLGSASSSLVEVCDGRFLWVHRDLFGEQTLWRVDADRVRAGREQTAVAQGQPQAIDALALGGLTRLLRGLDESFEFTTIEEASLGAFPVRILHGRWRPQRLVEILPDQRAALEQGQPGDLVHLPEHVPDQALVYLGRDDQFPYRFEYRRSLETMPKKSKATEPAVLLTMELFEVQVNGPIDTQQFIYDPGELPFEDATDAVLKGQGLLTTKPR